MSPDLDRDRDVKAHVPEQLVEDLAPGGKRFGRGLRGLDLLALDRQVGAAGAHLGLLAVAERARGAVAAVARAAVAAIVATSVTRRAAGRFGTRRTRATAIAPRAAPPAVVRAIAPVAAVLARPLSAVGVLAWLARWRWRQGGGRGGLAPRRGATQRRTRGSDDAGRLSAHAQHAPAARCQDLEVELIEAACTEGVTRRAQRLLDGLACELLVFAHRRLPRRLVRALWRAGLIVPAARSEAVRLSFSERRDAPPSALGGGGAGMATGKRGV